jgi:predicted RNase H-like nuclease (RuvC/YqgF family)
MGLVPSLPLSENQTEMEETITELKEVLRALKARLAQVESENAIMVRTVQNIKVSNNEIGRAVTKLNEKVFETPSLERNRSVRIPKGTRSLYVK